MSLSRFTILALAIAGTAVGLTGCSEDDGGTVVIGSNSIPVITGLSHQAALTNGQTPGGAAIRLQINGDDFDKNAEVILLAKAPATLSATAANLTSGVAGVTSQQCIRIPASNRLWQSQNRIDILTLPASPLAGTTQQGVVIVQVINPGGVASTDGTADGSSTSDELTYYADTGVQVTVTQSGPLAGAWANIFPGQNGVEFEAKITNMTLEPINSIALTNRALDFGSANPHALSYVVEESATTLAVGASTTARFVAGFSNELPEGALSASCGVTAVGATSGRSYTGTGGASVTAGSTPTINTRGGNLALVNVAAGDGGAVTITSEDGGTPAAEGGVTIGTATPAVTATTDALATTTTETTNIKTTLVGTSPVNVAAATPGVLVLGGTIELPTGARTWNFTGALPVVFRNVKIRFQNTVVPGDLTINAENTIQFINCTIDLRDQRLIPSAASGSLVVNGCTAGAGTVDIQNCTFQTNGIRGQSSGLAAGTQTIQTSGTAAGSPITITGSTLDMSGAGMVQANLALPITPTTNDTTPGRNFVLATVAGPIRVDGQTVIKTSGGSMIAVVGNAADVGAKPAGTVQITAGSSTANRNDLTFYGRIEAKGGDALNTAHTTAANRPNGGAVTIVARKVNIGNAAGRPVILTNGGSNALVGNLSLVGLTGGGTQGGTGGKAGAIDFIGTANQQGPFSLAAGAGLIAIGGGGDIAGGAGGAISFGVDQVNEATDAEATAQTVTAAGVADSSGGWVRTAKADETYADNQFRGGKAGAITVDGNTSVTVSGVLLACGGSPVRSGNTALPVGGANLGGDGNNVVVRAGLQSAGGAATDVGHLTLSGIASSRGGFYTTGTNPGGFTQNAGGNGGGVTLAGERLTVDATGKVVTDGGSCADAGQVKGGNAGAILLDSGIANLTIGAGNQAGALALNTTHLLMQGTLQADGGDVAKGGDTVRGQFNAERIGTPGKTVTVTWPSHGAATGDLITVTVAGTVGTAANVSERRITKVSGDVLTYEADSNVPVGTYLADMSLTRIATPAQGGSNSVTVRQDNVAKVQLTAPSPADRVEVSGTIRARAGKERASSLALPGGILVTGSRVVGGTAGQNDGGNVVITQSAVLHAAGYGTNTPLDTDVTIRTEDVGSITIGGKITVDNDRPGDRDSGLGTIQIEILDQANGTPTAADIKLESTAELLITGGHPGSLASSSVGVLIRHFRAGAIDLQPAFIRNEDQTVDPSQATGGDGGRIVVRGEGRVSHTAGEITARGTGSSSGHGGQIEFEATGSTTVSVVNLAGSGLASVNGGGTNGWGGRLQVRARVANGGGTPVVPAILVGGTYTMSADGSGLGGGGLPLTQSNRNSSNGFGGAGPLADGGIYIGGVRMQDINTPGTTAAIADQTVTLSTTTALTARGGDNGSGVRNANGTPASGCVGGVIVLGDRTTGAATLNPIGPLLINSSMDVSGGKNNAGPGGSGGQITVTCNSNTSSFAVASAASVSLSANGGSTSFPQSTGGPAGNILITGNGNGTMAIGSNGNAFRASLVGGGGTTVGGDAGVFQLTNNATTTGIPFVSSTVSVTGGTGSITGANGVVRLIATNAATAFTVTGTGQATVVTGLTVEPANGATGNPVQTLFIQE